MRAQGQKGLWLTVGFSLFLGFASNLFAQESGSVANQGGQGMSGDTTGIKGQVLDDLGRPVTNAPLTIRPVTGNASGPVIGSTMTSGSGGYSFPDLPPGDYILSVDPALDASDNSTKQGEVRVNLESGNALAVVEVDWTVPNERVGTPISAASNVSGFSSRLPGGGGGGGGATQAAGSVAQAQATNVAQAQTGNVAQPQTGGKPPSPIGANVPIGVLTPTQTPVVPPSVPLSPSQ